MPGCSFSFVHFYKIFPENKWENFFVKRKKLVFIVNIFY